MLQSELLARYKYPSNISYISMFLLVCFLHTVIEKLKKHPDAAEFIDFVKKERAPKYYKVIKYPMCLNEIQDRIKQLKCDTPQLVCYVIGRK